MQLRVTCLCHYTAIPVTFFIDTWLVSAITMPASNSLHCTTCACHYLARYWQIYHVTCLYCCTSQWVTLQYTYTLTHSATKHKLSKCVSVPLHVCIMIPTVTVFGALSPSHVARKLNDRVQLTTMSFYQWNWHQCPSSSLVLLDHHSVIQGLCCVFSVLPPVRPTTLPDAKLATAYASH